ncbi:MAG: hypothetical protein LBL72_06400 [Candidatus Accumulibacter sp.]|jgi:hypothetical protein|nr:hypothetical protein [Accumulibacter sp.]
MNSSIVPFANATIPKTRRFDIVVHDAVTGSDEGMGALRFIRKELKPLLATRYSMNKTLIIVDPAATQWAQTDERTAADIFRTEGYTVAPAMTKAIAVRLAVVEKYLSRQVGGQPGILIDPKTAGIVTALAKK